MSKILRDNFEGILQEVLGPAVTVGINIRSPDLYIFYCGEQIEVISAVRLCSNPDPEIIMRDTIQSLAVKIFYKLKEKGSPDNPSKEKRVAASHIPPGPLNEVTNLLRSKTKELNEKGFMSTKPAPGTCCPDMKFKDDSNICEGCGTKHDE